MRAGSINCVVKLQALSSGEDAIGGQSTSWSDVATIWADIRYLSGLEAVKAGSEVSKASASARIRYRTDVKASMRLLHEGKAYEIKAVLPDVGKKRHVDLLCEVVS